MRSAADLRSQAARCRSLAKRATDERLVANLLSLASDYDDEAAGTGREAPQAPNPLPG